MKALDVIASGRSGPGENCTGRDVFATQQSPHLADQLRPACCGGAAVEKPTEDSPLEAPSQQAMKEPLEDAGSALLALWAPQLDRQPRSLQQPLEALIASPRGGTTGRCRPGVLVHQLQGQVEGLLLSVLAARCLDPSVARLSLWPVARARQTRQGDSRRQSEELEVRRAALGHAEAASCPTEGRAETAAAAGFGLEGACHTLAVARGMAWAALRDTALEVEES